MAASCVFSTARGATYSWNNPAGGSWSIASNWSPSGIPGEGDIANVTLAGTYTVSLSANVLVSELKVGGPSGTATLGISNQTIR